MPDGKSQERELKAGTFSWNEAVTHAVENIGSTELQEIQIELKEITGTGWFKDQPVP